MIFKNSVLDGLSSYDGDISSCKCPNCNWELEFNTSEATGYDVEVHGLLMSLECPHCGYSIEVSGKIDYTQRQNDNGDWVNPDNSEYDDLPDLYDWVSWDLYYDNELNAVALEVKDSRDNSVRYICENPEVIENNGRDEVDKYELLNQFTKDIKGKFAKLPIGVLNFYIHEYEYFLDKLEDLDEDTELEFGYVDSGHIKINWNEMNYESGDCESGDYTLQDIVDCDDNDPDEYPPLTEEEKKLFHNMESDIIDWLNHNYSNI